MFKSCHSEGFRDVRLPQKVTCAECNYLLYEDKILKSPQDIIKKFDGRCPNCKRTLNFEITAVRITPYDEKSDM